MRAFAIALVLACAPALSQVPAEKARLAPKKDPVPRAKPLETRDGATARTTTAEKRRMDTLGKASKDRHRDAQNAIRNER